ncbi:MAG TPA: 30S ribosomal protein S2 [Candidatus Moranbacteria bacterium]|nr:30S ribosomal protein S2 [Candidatus Moranbacteria bacterium]HAT74544.1 30S ribosomal protein S2 [Candidatus Moranbacteria bacterium]
MTNEKKPSSVSVETAAGENEAIAVVTVDCFSGVDFEKIEINMEEMFKSGVHFGHHKSRKNPRMNEYIFGVKNGINIIDLQKTAEKLKEALRFMEQIIIGGQKILFVGTKKQAKKIVEAAAKRCEMPFVTERWLGGTFTNFSAISGRTRYLREGQEKMKTGEYDKYTKFEQMKFAEELERLEMKMGGIKNMDKLPGAILVTGMIEDNLAVKEAKIKNVSVIALADSNIDPRDIDYIIPANEDAVSSLKIIMTYVIKTILAAKKKAVIEKEASLKAVESLKNKE